MKRAPYSSYNPYFIFPCILWGIVGGLMLLLEDKQTLFSLFNTHYNKWSDDIMRMATHMGEGPFISVTLLVLLGLSSLRNWWYFIMAFISNVLPALLTQAVKHWLNEPRPLKYFNDAPWIHFLPAWERLTDYSFPSGHTCAAFSLYGILSCLLRPGYRYFGMVFFALAMLVGYSRMYLAAHFFEDVYAGGLIGAAAALLTLGVMRSVRSRFFEEV